MQTEEKDHVAILRDWYRETGELNHAYLLERTSSETRKKLLYFLEEDVQIAITGNPDVFSVVFETFGIDTARELGERASKSSFHGGRKIFIIETMFMTVQAQNALLKILEDPSKGTHFFFLMGGVHTLLPTVLSRLMRISGAASVVNEKYESAEVFLAGTGAERITFIKTFLKNAGEEKEKSAAIALMNTLERQLYAKADGGVLSHEIAQALEEIMLCRGFAYDQSSSVKMLLEHLALLVPKV